MTYLPPLYPILDAARFSSAPDPLAAMARFAEELIRGGATLIQYRNKSGNGREMLSHARELRRITSGRARLIINDRTDICMAANCDGVHLGQDDLSPMAARSILDSALPDASGEKPAWWIGFSTHNLQQVVEAELLPVDYIAVGPVFSTGSKANPDPVIGLEGVRQARKITSKPLVAIGGITRENCRQVIEAGANSVAVIADLVESPTTATEQFLSTLR
ncbi:MAG TPA: thiamine phosphate synthase [Candidatus Angelobacter sp.]|jgi:thiamine-phosphate pyrophosphorylase|nr:thiamine phosphate synthase [Candidatus Angelobacter sp.]